jgi:Glycosyl hydrolases family 16
MVVAVVVGGVAVAGLVLGVTRPWSPSLTRLPSPPRWQLTESYSGAQIAQQWKQFTPGGPYCRTPGTFSVRGRTLDLSVGGVYGNCTRFTSTFTAGFGKTAARMYIPRDVVADRAAWPAFWGYTESRVWPTAGEIDVYEQPRGGGLACATYHWGQPSRPRSTGPHCVAITAGWHTFAVVWSRHVLSFYYDGKYLTTFRGQYIHDVPVNWLVEEKSYQNSDPIPTTVRVLWWKHWVRT